MLGARRSSGDSENYYVNCDKLQPGMVLFRLTESGTEYAFESKHLVEQVCSLIHYTNQEQMIAKAFLHSIFKYFRYHLFPVSLVDL
jgi:hypothetical protein